MSTPFRMRWGGLAALLAGLLYWIGMPGAAEVFPLVPHVAGHALFALAGLFSLFGLLGLAAYASGRYGRLGALSLVVTWIGAALVCIGNGAEAILVIHESFSWTSQVYSLGLLVSVLGLILLGISAWRTQAIPRWSALVLILAPLAFLVIFIGALSILVATGNTSQSAAQSAPWLVATNFVVAAAFGLPWLAMGYTTRQALPADQSGRRTLAVK